MWPGEDHISLLAAAAITAPANTGRCASRSKAAVIRSNGVANDELFAAVRLCSEVQRSCSARSKLDNQKCNHTLIFFLIFCDYVSGYTP